MGCFVPAGIYSGLLEALMKGGVDRLEEFEHASGEPREKAVSTDLILRDRESTAQRDEPPAPPFDRTENEARSRRE